MASGLNIHIDKENATPSFVPRGKGGLTQATPRKALYDVNKDPMQSTSLKNTWSEGFIKPPADTHRPSMRKKINTPSTNKNEHIKMPLQENKTSQKKEVKPSQHPSSAKASKSHKRVPKKPAPVPDDEDGYDSDTIWPRAERLSTHIHNILAWRPSCFIGNDHDSNSDSDSSLSDGEISDQIIMERPAMYCPFMETPDVDMASILASLPDPEKPSTP